MNRINPLYIVTPLLLLFLILLYQNMKIEKDIVQKEQTLRQLEKKVIKIAALKRYWGDKKLQKRRILALLNTPFIKSYLKTKEEKGDKIKVTLQHIDAKKANQVVQKILNSFVNISWMKIEKKKNDKIDMRLEFTL